MEQFSLQGSIMEMIVFVGGTCGAALDPHESIPGVSRHWSPSPKPFRFEAF